MAIEVHVMSDWVFYEAHEKFTVDERREHVTV